MQLPKMIIFDYGGTLVYDRDWNPKRGTAELLKHVTKNPNNWTLEDIRQTAEIIYGDYIESLRQLGFDIGAQIADRVLYGQLGIEFALTPQEMEMVFWQAASDIALMPHAAIMLQSLNALGIRTAVISNLIWSSESLAERLKKFFPQSNFEFVMTSSDYMVRKPHPMLFNIALQKAGLNAAEVWYCGDNPHYDIEAASQVGIFPVWYERELPGQNKKLDQNPLPTCNYLHIHDWLELAKLVIL